MAKSIDYEGTMYVRETERKDRVDERYRYVYQRPRITIEARTYDVIEEATNMMHVSVMMLCSFDQRLGSRVFSYRAKASGARAVRVAYLTEPHLKHPEKKRSRLILEIYRASPEIRA